MYEPTEEELRRKERERQIMKEGIDIWKQQKRYSQEKQYREKREVRELLEKYWPWGRAGGGAPNGPHVGLRNVHLEELYAEEDMKKASRHTGPTVIRWGSKAGGSGAPQFYQTGKRRVGFIEDPQLRFQFCEDLRKTVDNTLRYKISKEEKEKYKKQLDKLVAERNRIKEEENRRNLEIERKLGWTNETVMKNLQKLNRMRKQSEEMYENKKSSSAGPKTSGGEELVPLLVKKKRQLKVPLSTTDVTRGDALNNRCKVGEPTYLKDLTDQVKSRNQQKKVQRVEDVEKVRRHFETWSGLWGRPGHGAPTNNTHKMRLDLMWIYPQPATAMAAVH